jgi:DNA replication and repair protein RecF
MTGADPAAFTDVGAAGEVFNVDSGQIARGNLGAAPSG